MKAMYYRTGGSYPAVYPVAGSLRRYSLPQLCNHHRAATTTSAPPTTTAPATSVTTTAPQTTAPHYHDRTSTTPATTAEKDKYGGVWKAALTVGPSTPLGYMPEAANDSMDLARPAWKPCSISRKMERWSPNWPLPGISMRKPLLSSFIFAKTSNSMTALISMPRMSNGAGT